MPPECKGIATHAAYIRLKEDKIITPTADPKKWDKSRKMIMMVKPLQGSMSYPIYNNRIT